MVRKGVSWRRARLLVLTALLLAVCLYALGDLRRRRARNDWQRSLQVAVVLLHREALDPRALARLVERAPALEQRLADELARYRPEAPRPVQLQVVGPLAVTRAPPLPDGEGWWSALRYTWKMWRYTRAADEAVSIAGGAHDTRIYVSLRNPLDSAPAWVEGVGELGGRVAQVSVDLDVGSVDLAWIVVAHELLHTLGASDKYADDGRVLVPDGLPEPQRIPLYPQRFVEVMARNLAIDSAQERPPDDLSELAIGPATAREIGWLPH